MSEFLFEYSLFAAKIITVIATILLSLMAIGMILSSRQKEREFIEIEKINEKFDTLKEALEGEILTKEELKTLKKERKKEQKEIEKNEKRQIKEGKTIKERHRLFVLRFHGDINASEVNNLREAITAVLSVVKPNDEVLTILESSGGFVHDYGLAASQLRRFRDKNVHLTVSVDLVAASGGYLMASVANKIIAAPFAIIGSIGVLAQLPNFNRLLEKHDIDIEQHTAGEYKTTLTMLGKNTDKARKKFREELEDTHALFKSFVSEHRSELPIDKLATGEHWYGSQALALKLVDEILTSDDYLLQKSACYDIYEVTYVISESLSEKISKILQGITCHLSKKIWGFFTNKNWIH